ncbi:MAG: hypothetical protein K2X52_19540 [Mycobacteriaceae bacterium]|nr:hypothetical protein [Mycobacteriaceae bacterium]
MPANLASDGGSVMRDLMLLRLRALIARSDGDDPAYRELVRRYGAMAESLGFDGHVAWAEDGSNVVCEFARDNRNLSGTVS